MPDGLGVREGSTAVVYTLLGVPFEQATLTGITVRAVYYLVPFLVSLGFYWRFVRGESPKVS